MCEIIGLLPSFSRKENYRTPYDEDLLPEERVGAVRIALEWAQQRAGLPEDAVVLVRLADPDLPSHEKAIRKIVAIVCSDADADKISLPVNMMTNVMSPPINHHNALTQ